MHAKELPLYYFFMLYPDGKKQIVKPVVDFFFVAKAFKREDVKEPLVAVINLSIGPYDRPSVAIQYYFLS